jgi:trk system potassium uptake protein TrkA
MYIIVVGAGRTGQKVIDLATRRDHEVVAVERNQARAEEVSAAHDCLVINADAASRSIMLEAGIEEADALIATTADDSVNLMTSMLGERYGVDILVSSVDDPDHRDIIGSLGVNTVESPHELIGRYLFRAVERPAILDFMRLEEGAEVLELTVSGKAPVVGATLDEADREGLIDEDSIVVAVQRDEAVLIPRGGTRIQAGDHVTILSLHGAAPRVTQPFTQEED